MANEEHLRRLSKGQKKWNHWRKKNPEIKPDLSFVSLLGASLSFVNLCKANLCKANLSGASLSRADLSKANLSKANLSKANLSGADLRKANLSRANLLETNLLETNLSGVDLSGANLLETNLSRVDLSRANLSRADLSRADLSRADLSNADLSNADLSNADLSNADLSNASLRETTLRGADLSNANFRGADLSKVNLSKVDLGKVDFRGADLSGFDLSGFDLSGADLSETNLSGVNFVRSQMLRTNFERAVFTGACLEDWNINSATNFEGAICDYVYLKAKQQERRPREGIFKPGEFAALFQQALDTIDLIFKDGIDWQAFFQSFQELRSQNPEQDFVLQAIEKKQGNAFVVRLEVFQTTDKALVESQFKELYKSKVDLIEKRYRAKLQAKDSEIVAYREQSANLMEIVKLQASRPITVEATAVADSSNRKTDLRGAQFSGGYAEVVQGNQVGGTINNYGPNTEDITRLLTALRDQVQSFPTDQKEDANDVLDDLERDLKEEQPDQGRIGRRLKKLFTLGAAIGTIASGAAAVSGDGAVFTGNVIELTEKLGIPIEQVQLPPSGTP